MNYSKDNFIFDNPQLAFDGLYNFVSLKLDILCSNYPACAIDNINGYRIGFLKKILNTIESLRVVIEISKDYPTSSAILRIIADHFASYFLIYKRSEGDESKLRHYLFIIDGMEDRIRGMRKINPQPNDIVSVERNNLIKTNMNSQMQESIKVVESCVKHIKNLHVYTEHQTLIDGFLSKPKDKWKFKTLDGYDKKSPNFSWKKMYSFIYDNEDVPTYFSYLSEFAHGMSASNLVFDITQETFTPIYVYAISLLGIIRDVVENDFNLNGMTGL